MRNHLGDGQHNNQDELPGERRFQSAPSQPDDEQDRSVLEEMGWLLDNGRDVTGSFAANDQFGGGPLVGLDQFSTSVMLQFDQLETMVMPAIRHAPPRDRRDSPIANMPTLRGRTSARRSETDHPVGGADPASAATTSQPGAESAPTSRSDQSAWATTSARLNAVVPAVESFASVARKLLKSSGFYALSSLGSPAVSLALTPYMAHNLTPTDYGKLAILNTVISLASGVTQLGLGSAFFRSYNYDYTSKRDRRSVLATVSLLLLLISAAVAVLGLLFAPVLSWALFQRSDLGSLIDLAAFAIVAQNLTTPGLAWLRAENRALLFALVSMANVLSTLGATIVLVGYLQQGVHGAILAVTIGSAVAVALVFPVVLVQGGLRINPQIARGLLSFGAPMVTSVISMWILQLSDRYLLELYGTLAETASYSIAYTLGSVLSTLILAPFGLAWPTAMYAIAKRRDAPQTFQTVFRWFTSVLLFAAFGVSLVSDVAFHILFPPSYQSAAPVIPIVAASIAFYGIYTFVMTGVSVRRKTWMASIFTAIAAGVNVGLNLVLIPRYGAMGAAYSTLIAYVTLAGVAYVANQRIYPLPYQLGRFILAAVVGVAMYYEVFALPTYLGARWVWPLAIVGLVVYGVWLAALTLLIPGATVAPASTPQPAVS